MDHLLQLKNVSVSYGTFKALKNVNMNIERHKITALIGPSGCGKTTLLKVLNRMLEEDKTAVITGDILLAGTNIKSIHKEEIRKKIGLVFQTPTPFPFSIYKNLTYALKYHGVTDRSSLNLIIEEKLKMVGLYEEVKNNMDMSALKLSGGQQQRLCIARTLTVNPEIILLDEPCSALDPKATQKIEDTLIKLCNNYTIVIVTHNLAQAKRIAHNVAFIYEGQLIEYDTTDIIFSNPQHELTRNYVEGFFG